MNKRLNDEFFFKKNKFSNLDNQFHLNELKKRKTEDLFFDNEDEEDDDQLSGSGDSSSNTVDERRSSFKDKSRPSEERSKDVQTKQNNIHSINEAQSNSFKNSKPDVSEKQTEEIR